MYASITNFIAQNEMQMDIRIEFFKSQSAKLMTDAGAIQISITKTATNKAVLMNVFPSKEIAMKAREVLAQKALLNTSRPNTKLFEALYKNSSAECDRLAAAQGRLDISVPSQKRQWNKLQQQMFEAPTDLANSDVDNLLRNFSGQLGPCTVRNYIDRTLEMINLKDINVKYVGRQASSSTATGNANKHLAQQKEILEKILKD